MKFTIDEYTPDIHTARSETWRGEEWLEARGYGWDRICKGGAALTEVWTPQLQLLHSNTDHAAAIAEAVRRVNE